MADARLVLYDSVGEVRFGGNWMANALSRVDLTVMRHIPDGDEPVEDGLAVDALNAIFGGETGRSQMMGTYAKTVPESPHAYLMQQQCPDRDGYDQMVALIRRAGDIRPWRVPGTDRWIRYRYLTLDDGYDYWATTRPRMYSLNRRVHVEPGAPTLPV